MTMIFSLTFFSVRANWLINTTPVLTISRKFPRKKNSDGKVALKRVEAGQTHEGLRVITAGLEAGVPVIVDALHMIQPGLAVKTTPVVATARASDTPTIEAAALEGRKTDGAHSHLSATPKS